MLVGLVEDVRVQEVEQTGCDNKPNQGDSTCGSQHDNFCRLVLLFALSRWKTTMNSYRWWKKYLEVF